MEHIVFQLYEILEKRDNVKLTIEQKHKVLEYVKRIPQSVFYGYDKHTIIRVLLNMFKPKNNNSNNNVVSTNVKNSSIILEDFRSTPEGLNEFQQNNVSEVDYTVPNYVDELKQGDVSIMNILGITTQLHIQRLLSPDSLLERHYLCLDSRFRLNAESKDASFNILQWAYAPTSNIQSGFVYNPNEIKNIKGIRLYQLRIPWDTGTYPTMRMISILFHEFAAQSIISYTQRKFHFLWQVALPTRPSYTIGTQVYYHNELFPESDNDAMYAFQQPIKTFDTLTYSLGDPYTLMSIYHDRDTCTFTYASQTIINTTQPHYFTIGSTTWVTINGFTTNAPTTDSLAINNINNQYGLEVYVLGASTLRIPYISTTTITATPDLIANVYFDRRRIFMHMEFICLKN